MVKKILLGFVTFVVLIVLYLYLTAPALTVEKPPRQASPVSIEQPPSYLSIRAHIDLQAAQDTLNRKFPKRLASFDGRGRRGFLRYKWYGYVDKTSDFVLKMDGDQVVGLAPVFAKITGKMGVRETAEARANVTVKATPQVTPDWKIKLPLAHHLHWTQRPTLELFGFIRVTVTGKAEEAIDRELPKIKQDIAKTLEKVELKQKVAKLWQGLQQPIALPIDNASDESVHIALNPRKVDFSGVSGRDKKATLSLTLHLRPHIAFGATAKQKPVEPLPVLSTGPLRDDSAIALPISLSYEFLQDQLAQHLSEPLKVDAETTVQLSDMELYPATDKVVVGVNVRVKSGRLFDATGRVYVWGKLSVEGQRLVLQDPQFTLESADVLSNVVSSAAQSIILKELRAKLQYDFTKKLDALKTSTSNKLNQRYEFGTLSTSLGRVKFGQVLLGENALHLVVNLAFTSSVSVDFTQFDR